METGSPESAENTGTNQEACAIGAQYRTDVRAPLAKRPARRRQESPVHAHLVRSICDRYEGVQTRGFNKRLYQIMRNAGVSAAEMLYDGPARLIPDAYIADGRRGNLIVFEVECGHKVSADKMAEYMMIGADLVGLGWEFIIVFVSERGSLAYYNARREMTAPDHGRKLLAALPA